MHSGGAKYTTDLMVARILSAVAAREAGAARFSASSVLLFETREVRHHRLSQIAISSVHEGVGNGNQMWLHR